MTFIHTPAQNLKNIKYNFTGHTRGFYHHIKSYVKIGMVIMCPKSAITNIENIETKLINND